jgi:hypothetical protein
MRTRRTFWQAQAANNGLDYELTYVCHLVHAVMHENDCSIG